MARPAGSIEDMQREAPERCDLCPHPFGPHKVFILGENVTAGGVIICNEPGCQCVATWAIRGTARPALPEEETLSRLREFAQGERHWEEP